MAPRNKKIEHWDNDTPKDAMAAIKEAKNVIAKFALN